MKFLRIKQTYYIVMNLPHCRCISYTLYITENFIDNNRTLFCHGCVLCRIALGFTKHSPTHRGVSPLPHWAPTTQIHIACSSLLHCHFCCIITCFYTTQFMTLHSIYVHVQFFIYVSPHVALICYV